MTRQEMTHAEYLRRDLRCKCAVCGRWMRYHPTKKTPARRREAPYANRCTDCRKPCKHCGARHGRVHRDFCFLPQKLYEAPDD